MRNGGFQLCSSLAQLPFSNAGYTEGSAELLKEAQSCEVAESKAGNSAAWRPAKQGKCRAGRAREHRIKKTGASEGKLHQFNPSLASS